MSRSRIVLLILLSAYHTVCFAQRDASIVGMLKPIVAKIAADPNVGSWEWEHNRNGGYLLRMQVEVTGDDRPELFVASTLQSSKYAHVWHVYDVTGDGELRPYRTTLSFISATPRTEKGMQFLDLFPFADEERLRISDEKPYRVVHYSFSYPTVKETTSFVSEADAIRLQPNEVSQLPKLQAILLADYLANPDAKWSQVVELKRDAGDYYFRPEDKERATKNVAFTPQAALSLLGQMQPVLHSGNAQETTPTPKPPPAPVEKQTPKPAATPRPTEKTKPAPSGFPIVPVTIVGALVVGIVLYLLRRKSK